MYPFVGGTRGGFAPRRGRARGGRVPFFAKPRELVKPDLEKHPLGDLVKEFHISHLSLHQDVLANITDCHYVASYNWLNDEVPTIVIPGKPPRWTPLHSPRRLKEDSGQYFRDPNAAKFPDYPMAPVVHAVVESDTGFDTATTDLFACGSTLGNLLRFARGIDKAFRFNVEVVGDTVFFVRKENDPQELIRDVRGFGHTFPEANTTWEHSVKGSDTHQRIIRYDFAGLSCLVRFESDGYIPDATGANRAVPVPIAEESDDLLQAFSGAAISQSTSTTIKKHDTLKVKRGGSLIPQESVFDLKTRSGRHKKDIDMSDIYPLLWIKQIPNFIVAYHDGNGLFEDIRVQQVKKDVHVWARDNREGIRRFAALLKNIVVIARSDSSKLLEVYCPGSDRLEIRRQHGHGAHALPPDLSVRWKKSNSAGMPAGYDASDDLNHHDEDGFDLDDKSDLNAESDDAASEPDYTACSAHDCGYCGKCTY